MTINQKLFALALVSTVIAGSIYTYAYSRERSRAQGDAQAPAPAAKVAPATEVDGTYAVQIHSVMTSPEDTVLTFSHITYLEGDEARASAAKEASCGDIPLDACVPTLTRGYYARESGAPDFTAPVSPSTVITLKDKDHATPDDLRNLSRQFNPAFDVVLASGMIVSLTERSPIK